MRKLIYQHAGISLSPVKQDMVYSRLARRLRATGKGSFGEYLDMLEKGGADEWERFVNSLTTNLTSFFREPHHFPIFAEHLKKLGTRNPALWCFDPDPTTYRQAKTYFGTVKENPFSVGGKVKPGIFSREFSILSLI